MNEPIPLDKPVLGINNVAEEHNLPQGSVRGAVNVDINNSGDVFLRDGETKVYSGANIHSLFERYFVEGSELKLLAPDYSASVIESGLSNNAFLAYCKVHGDIYYSDGKVNRIINKGAWGIPTPPSNPSLSTTTGLLDKGTYQVTICYQEHTGELSGADLAYEITVDDRSGILVSDIPVSPDGYDVALFVSTANGEQLYQNAVIPNGLTSYTIISVKSNTRILDTQFMSPLPGGHIIRHFKGRMYVARENVLWYSQAMRYGLRKISKDFFQFPQKISIVQPVTDGIYVVSDKTYFLAGTEPKQMQQSIVSDDPGIEGTGVTVGGAAFGLEANLEVGYWFSSKGAVLGMPGGLLKLLTEDRLAINDGIDSGTTLFREKDGIRQMITSFINKGTESDFSFGAQATSAVYRNGVLID